ncbi:MAG: bifunctional 5,10-methylene-tetrahydrofolate dehydrogenase/5,10-methylene-tetrahydrofolate cyclohydrolase, partial [Candidatus Aminicenantes bacterium]|nr:bifunctional 5,10-methylene-tetrahydrofolate dehydrogenase/5,10-methylene-tetrahydrofolate cyclohydrolase [Candidatus Aminicenantes bacterium]
MGVWLAGKPLADKIKAEVAEKAAAYKARTGRVPGLAAVLVGDNKASQVYVRTKERTSGQLGFASRVLRLPDDIGARALEERIRELNGDDEIDGILVQLPLPGHLDPWKTLEAIDPRKDVDGL